MSQGIATTHKLAPVPATFDSIQQVPITFVLCYNWKYAVCCRGVGCVLFEMASGRPLFPGSSIDNQLQLIFCTLGTPTDSSWPGVTAYKSFESFKSTAYKPECLITSAPRYCNICSQIDASTTSHKQLLELSFVVATVHKVLVSYAIK